MSNLDDYKKRNQDKFFDNVLKKFGNKFNLSNAEYVNNKTKVKIICPEHGEFEITPQSFLKSHYGCPKCGKKSGGEKRGIKQRKSKEDFVNDAIRVHGDKYDYSKVDYIDAKTKVCIICPIHGEFWQTPENHLQGNGCKKCGRDIAKEKVLKKQEAFLKEAIKVHGNKYDYSKSEYIGANKKLCIICPKHGEFWQEPHNHLRGCGCPYCDNKFKTTYEFINGSKLVHGDKYDYSKVEYVDARTKVRIICPIHGEFIQSPFNHLNNHGCPKCSHPISKWEKEIYDFLISLGIDCEQSNRSILDGKEIDIFIPKYNIGIECDGLRWHNELYRDNNYHLFKTNDCSEHGVRLIHIFEDEWAKKSEIWKSMFRNMLGLVKDKIYARKCKIKEVSSKACRNFLDENHIQGYSNSKINYGLYYNGELVSLMTFGCPRINMGGKKQNGYYELVRFCNKINTNVIGGASKLFKHFIDTINPIDIVSYSDKRWSLGNLYQILGFEHTHDSKPNYFYVYNMERLNRFRFRKSLLINEGFDKDKSEHHIMIDRGIYRIYDCGTMVWKWHKTNKG